MTTVTQEPNTQPPVVAWIRALHDRLLKAEILASAGRVHPVVDMPDAFRGCLKSRYDGREG
jgi:hypothetical protein